MRLSKEVRAKINNLNPSNGQDLINTKLTEAWKVEKEIGQKTCTTTCDGVVIVCKGTGEPVNITLPDELTKQELERAILDAMHQGWLTVATLRNNKALEVFGDIPTGK